MEAKEEDQPPKWIKSQETLDPEEEEEEDRISLLPDRLIIDEILSRLESTKEAIRTGTLSKRWLHLWPSVPSLCFYDYHMKRYSPSDHSYKRLPDFYLSVDKTLTQCRHRQLKNLNKFQVRATYENRFESHVDNWVHFATSSNVQQLHLYLRNTEDHFVLEDDSFFINSHFTHLDLGGCIFNPTGPITWNNLTTLSISNGKLDLDLIANILSGSPLLDTLGLIRCYGFSRLDITSKSVKNLMFYDTDEDDEFDNLDHIIEINAPYISSLTIKGVLLLWKILLRDVSSLVKADLDYTKVGHDETRRKEERQEILKRFIPHLHHVKELKIGIFCYKEDEEDFSVLEDDSFFINSHFTHLHSGGCIFNPNGPISWNNLTHLTISNGKLDQDLIANILSGSPLLDTLTLDDCYGYSWLDITSKSVKNLVFSGYTAQDDKVDNLDHIIEINAPYISSLTIIGRLWLWKLLLRDVSSLVKADLDYTRSGHTETTYKEEREEMLKRFILCLHHVKELKIGISCYRVLSRLEAKGFIFPSNLKVVEVTYPPYDTDSDLSELGDCSDNDSSVGDSSSTC